MKWRAPASLIISIGMHAAIVFLVVFMSRDSGRLHKSNIPLSLISRERTVVTAAGTGGQADDDPKPEDRRVEPARTKLPSGSNKEQQAESTMKTSSAESGSGGADDDKTGTDSDAHPDDEQPHEAESSPASSGTGDSNSGTGKLASGGSVGVGGESGSGGIGTGGNGAGNAAPGDGYATAVSQTTADSRTSEYALMVRRRLEQRGAYPKTARRLGLEGRVEMILKIDVGGLVADTRIHASSGFQQLDDAALASAGSMGLLPPPPDNKPIEIVVPVRFSMRRM